MWIFLSHDLLCLLYKSLTLDLLACYISHLKEVITWPTCVLYRSLRADDHYQPEDDGVWGRLHSVSPPQRGQRHRPKLLWLARSYDPTEQPGREHLQQHGHLPGRGLCLRLVRVILVSTLMMSAISTQLWYFKCDLCASQHAGLISLIVYASRWPVGTQYIRD